jgi:hypothetical protein
MNREQLTALRDAIDSHRLGTGRKPPDKNSKRGGDDMQIVNPQTRAAALSLLSLAALSVPTWAAAPTETVHGDWIAHDFKFHGGEVLSELHIRYTTVGERSGEPVLILHGTGGAGDGLLTQQFAGRLFGPGQPLDAPSTSSYCRTRSATGARPSRPMGSG